MNFFHMLKTNNMNIPFVDLKPMHLELKDKFDEAYNRVVYNESQFIYGNECKLFEEEYASYVNAKYCVGVGNGLDALFLTLKALDIKEGDEVIIPSNTYIATALAVSYTGATPILVDPTIESYNIDITKIEEKITNKTRCIIPVHLQGRPSDLDEINRIAKKHNLHVIDDAAQAHGTKYKGRKIGSLTECTCWSFYPGKNLGALGDGGCITTNNKALADKIRVLGDYGSDYKYHHIYKGNNSRLDEFQAAFLRVKLTQLDKWNDYRKKVANRYLTEITNPLIILPLAPNSDYDHIYHVFAIRCNRRDELEKYLNDNGINTVKHYPIPIHMQECYKELEIKEDDLPIAKEISTTELSIPIYYKLSEEMISYTIDKIKSFK